MLRDANCRLRTESLLRPKRACNRDASEAAVDGVNTPVRSQHHYEALNEWRFRDDLEICRQPDGAGAAGSKVQLREGTCEAISMTK